MKLFAKSTTTKNTAGTMKIDATTFAKLPEHLKVLFSKAPNPGRDEVVAGFPVTGPSKASMRGVGLTGDDAKVYGKGDPEFNTSRGHNDNGGSAARFFYAAKASKRDRDDGLEGFDRVATGAMDGNSGRSGQRTAGDGVTPVEQPVRANIHPTVKPTDLMAYLCRLVTPPGGVVLDPFMGSGSTGKAAVREGFQFVGIEREVEYLRIATARIEAQICRQRGGPARLAA